jgi:hypothetical protein
MSNVSLIVSVVAYGGIISTTLLIVFEVAKHKAENNFIQCAALRAYRILLSEKLLSFDELKRIYVAEMGSVTGFAGDLTYEEARQILTTLKKLVKSKLPSNDRLQRSIQRTEKGLPKGRVSGKPEYFLAMLLVGAFIWGLYSIRPFLRISDPVLNDMLLPSAAIVIPGLIIISLTFIMTKWWIQSSSYRKELEKEAKNTWEVLLADQKSY